MSELDELYNPEITDLEANEYHKQPRPVIYLDEAEALLQSEITKARKDEAEWFVEAISNHQDSSIWPEIEKHTRGLT